MPNRHALVEAYHPPGKEDVDHVGVPLLDHLPDLPKLIDERRCSDVRERQVPLDRLELPASHVRPHVGGARAALLVRLLVRVAPIVVDGPSLLRRHEESDPENRIISPNVTGCVELSPPDC
jgi:hypothetical protein